MSAPDLDLTVLVVEDEWLLREDIAVELRSLGCTVFEADRGEEAVKLLRDEDIDLLITDIQLAGAMNGWEVARRARAADPRLPVIYASGNAANHPDRVRASLFVAKPCQPGEIVAACRKLTGGGRDRAFEARA